MPTMHRTSLRHFLSVFFGLSGVVLSITLALSYWQNPISGDLTRLGFYSERDFGGRSPPILHNIAATGQAVLRPDYWVLGDSFSRANQWQSVIQETTHLTSQTFSYDHVCLLDWVDKAITHPTIQTIILETAQINIVSRFSKLAPCVPQASKPVEVKASVNPSIPHQPSFKLATDWRIQHSLRTQINTWKINDSQVRTLQDSQVAISRLKPNCANFSNQRNDRILYQTGSLDHLNQSAATYTKVAANLWALQKRAEAQGKRFLLVVIPDKFSAYQSCIDDAEINQETLATCDILAPVGISCVNLMPMVKAERLKRPDLYLPNDTHFSAAGYRMLADAISPYLR
jgi:SGNH hydrolase-like domain, acetyltransferase AlgX